MNGTRVLEFQHFVGKNVWNLFWRISEFVVRNLSGKTQWIFRICVGKIN